MTIRLEGFGRTSDYTPAEARERLAAFLLHTFSTLTETDALAMAQTYVDAAQTNPMPIYENPAAQKGGRLLLTISAV